MHTRQQYPEGAVVIGVVRIDFAELAQYSAAAVAEARLRADAQRRAYRGAAEELGYYVIEGPCPDPVYVTLLAIAPTPREQEQIADGERRFYAAAAANPALYSRYGARAFAHTPLPAGAGMPVGIPGETR